MYGILRVLRMLPMPVRFLGMFFLFIPLAILLARALGMGHAWWLFVLAILVIFLIVMGFNALVKARERRKARQFEGNLAASSRESGVGREEIREALAELSEKWQEAVKQLRTAGLSLYDLPWYLLIGEPQSGKSTTLQKSGIEFPVGTDALSGSGGTRNCDWWFANDAVILDTAGRFTFQEESAPDRHEWAAFLKLIKRYRRNCPINGVIVVIPATSLTEDTADEQERKAKNIRQKLLHLQKTLDIRLPVFILVTKADRILGFAEFCAQLDPVDQRQLFGWSNSDSYEKPWDPKRFGDIFDNIVRRVNNFRLRFLRAETNLSQVDKLFVFPEELAAVREPLANYLQTVFAPSRFEEPFIFRGFYITSGIQQGRPIARACRDLLRVQVGDPQGVVEDLEQVFRQSRAYFIRDFYEKKLFREQGLILRTQAAEKRDSVLRWVYRGLMAATVLVALLLILPARSSLKQLIEPIHTTAAAAERCLEGTQPCSVAEAWGLIHDLERQKTRLAESRWLWVFLRGRSGNEISQELLPAIQGRLLHDRVLPHLMASFDARAAAIPWHEHRAVYPEFYDAFGHALRLRELAGVRGPERQDELLPSLRLGSTLAFLAATPGLDPTPRGTEIDDWLAAAAPERAEADAIIAAVAGADPSAVVVQASAPDGARQAFASYWSMRNLAWWDWALLDHFRVHLDSLGRIATIDPAMASDAFGTLTEFVAVGQPFAANWIAANQHFGTPRTEETSTRPGSGVDAWIANCTGDLEALKEIAGASLGLETVGICSSIPADWQRLLDDRGQYAFLYDVKTAEDGRETFSWSEPARQQAEPLAQLAEAVQPEKIQEGREVLRRTIAERLGDRERLDALASFRQQREEEIMGSARALENLTGLPPELNGPAVADTARAVVAVALADQILTPAVDYFRERFDTTCADCFDVQYARDFVPPANDLLSWSHQTLGDALGNPAVAALVEELSDLEYAYLAEFVQREAAAAGGGSPGGFQRPYAAAKADQWSDFVGEIRRWNLVSSGRPARVRSGGLSVSDLQQWARANDRLRDLVRQLERAQRAPASSGEPRVDQDLMEAANRFKRAVAGLEDDPLEAWRQLAGGRGESLADFHAFSGSPRLRGNPDAVWLEDNVEERGARLLVSALAQPFYRELERAWRDVEARHRGQFPFITERDLEEQRRIYVAGYDGGRNTLWANQTVDSGRREVVNTVVLPTISLADVDALFYRGGLDRLLSDYALDPILSGRETMIDFVGANAGKLRTLLEWQRFLYGDEGARFEPTSERFTFRVRLLPTQEGTTGMYLGRRMAQVDVFDRAAAIRPSTDANRDTVRDVGLRLDENTLSITGINEENVGGWTGRLDLRGGPLKLFHFVRVAQTGRPRSDGRIVSVRVQLPDFEAVRQTLDGVFEFAFDRPVPGVFQDLELREPPR